MKKQPKGFTIFFAALVGSLALAIGIAIYDITVRQLDLSGVGTQSQYAIYAADTGAECALYWDAKCALGACVAGSAFATSTASHPPTSGVICSVTDISSSLQIPPAIATASSATSTFNITFPSFTYCATVQVGKHTDVSGTVFTLIQSHGFNTCVAGAPNRLERIIQVSY